jgi:hypothetical protein
MKFYSSDTPESPAQCGFRQNAFCKVLLPENLDLKILRTNSLVRQDLASINRHCLDYHCAIADWGARSDSHCGCGKFFGGGAAAEGREPGQ